jgi:hypothetical protein
MDGRISQVRIQHETGRKSNDGFKRSQNYVGQNSYLKLYLFFIKHHTIKPYGGVVVLFHEFLILPLDGDELSASGTDRISTEDKALQPVWWH